SGERHWTRSQPEMVRRGRKKPMAKYTPEQIAEVKRLVADGGKTLNMIAAEKGVKKITDTKIKRGMQWTKEKRSLQTLRSCRTSRSIQNRTSHRSRAKSTCRWLRGLHGSGAIFRRARSILSRWF